MKRIRLSKQWGWTRISTGGLRGAVNTIPEPSKRAASRARQEALRSHDHFKDRKGRGQETDNKHRFRRAFATSPPAGRGYLLVLP